MKALLESDEIIVRGAIKHRVRLALLTKIRVDAGGFNFCVDGLAVTLAMAQDEAMRWQKKVTMPPPSLCQKLGLTGSARALVIGEIDDVTVRDALQGFIAVTASDATMVIAYAQDDGQLAAAVQAQRLLTANAVLWIVHGKGKATLFGEHRVRDGMRSRGYIDTKVASVSALLTASRFSRSKMGN